jgi:hypothetical protein
MLLEANRALTIKVIFHLVISKLIYTVWDARLVGGDLLAPGI